MYAPAINQTTTASPVKLEHTSRVRDRSASQSKGFGSRLGGGKFDEAVSGVAVS